MIIKIIPITNIIFNKYKGTLLVFVAHSSAEIKTKIIPMILYFLSFSLLMIFFLHYLFLVVDCIIRLKAL